MRDVALEAVADEDVAVPAGVDVVAVELVDEAVQRLLDALEDRLRDLVARIAAEKGIDLSKYKHDLTDEEIDAAIKELNDAGVIDEVKKIAQDLVKDSNSHLSLLPPSKERALLMEIGEFFVTRSY